DPYLNWHRGADRHERIDQNLLPDPTTTVAEALQEAGNLDLVGVWASGATHAGFASSHGQSAWHTVYSCSFDWSCHRSDGQALKGVRAGTTWDRAAWRATMERARTELRQFDQPRRRVEPGMYPVFLAPAAVHDLVGLLGWGGYSAKARKTRTSPLMRFESGQAKMSSLVTLREDAATGFAPAITAHGFHCPDSGTLINRGVCGESLVSARTAREYAMVTNSDAEYPLSLRMEPGELPTADAMRALDLGIWISNLHYLNYSDRSACRVTGMTRFACWWVENGEAVAPIEHMRFDDDLFGLFGDRLTALTREVELIPDTSTYDERSLRTYEVPGALTGMKFTL
ncbi:MAG: metallopeptidase TldD-related protein, partial [Planctomycetota bacterium]